MAVTLGYAGTAIDLLARQIATAAMTVTERKASVLIDVAQAFFQWGNRHQPSHRPQPLSITAPAGGGFIDTSIILG